VFEVEGVPFPSSDCLYNSHLTILSLESQKVLRDSIFRELIDKNNISSCVSTTSKKLVNSYFTSLNEESMMAMLFLSQNNADLPSAFPKNYNIDSIKLAECFINSSLLFKLRKFESISDPSQTESSENADIKTITNEFRDVTVIFCKLEYDFDIRQSQLALTGFVNIMKANNGCLQQFSGTQSYFHISYHLNLIFCFKVDDKGQTILGVFGLPPSTHLNETLPALKSAIDYYNFCKVNGMVVSIGIAKGPLLFSSLGSSFRKEASLLGDVVNIAARLMTMQCGEIQVEENAFASQVDFKLHSLGLKHVF
jgi:hypothetical protein